jgi:FkbM family methyltransferase
MIKSKINRLIKLLTGQVRHLKKTVNVNKKWYGNCYGGFYVCPEFLNQNSIIYSLGIGEDISFDMAVIKNHNCRVFGFDPTPKSITWVKQQQGLPAKFIFLEYGIADSSGLTDFYLPRNTAYVSGSFIKQKNVNDNQKISVEMKSWKDIVNILGHKQIDVLKMDIEGAEYNVIDSVLESSVPINQILIEFHDRLFNDGKTKTISVIKKIKNHGYEIFGVSESFEEVSFILNNNLFQNQL